jgi:demethylmenaquinone methyltransferase/2-methoxy-6-polyprenyl-1,4-benzoquinol methylase
MSTPTAPPINRVARELFAPLPRHYDVLVDLLSFGQNRRWRRAMVDRVVSAHPRQVLDVATGTAGVARQLASRTPATAVGVDLSTAMLAKGKENISGHRRIFLTAGRAEELPFPDEAFDAVTFTYLLRYVDDPGSTLDELARVLRPSGTMASLEFGVPGNVVLRRAWWLYTRVVLPIAGLPFGAGWYRVGRFLGPSIENHYRRFSVIDHIALWREAGLTDVGCRRMSLGGGLVMWGRKDG